MLSLFSYRDALKILLRFFFFFNNSLNKHSQSRMRWMKISCILCMFGCFKDFRPSESFVTDYLTGPWKNFTKEEVSF